MSHDPIVRFRDEPWTAGVMGLGYVGLPLSVTAITGGLSCIGFDVSEDRVAQIAAGRSHVEDVPEQELRRALEAGLRITDDAALLAEADALFICVPSPLGRNRQPDMSHIEAAAETVSAVVRAGMLICLESTTYPGTTEEIVVPAATAAGLVLDRDVYVAFSPERVSPGSDLPTASIPKVVGGVTSTSGQVAAAAYSRLVTKVHLVESARAAEMAKLLENTYRAVNIGLINEMAQLAHELDIDIWEVIEAAETKPFGFQAFYPGPGVGGHCIPLDPQFLAWRAKEALFATRFIDLAEQVNTKMPRYTAARVSDLLNQRGVPVFDTRVLAIGIAYKPNVADYRESAALQVLAELQRRGARIDVLDPVVPSDRIAAQGFRPVDPDEDLSVYELAVVLTDHDSVNLESVADQVPLIFDTRGAYRRRGVRRDNVTVL